MQLKYIFNQISKKLGIGLILILIVFIDIFIIAYNGVFEQCFQKYLNTFDKNIF